MKKKVFKIQPESVKSEYVSYEERQEIIKEIDRLFLKKCEEV